MGRPLGSKNKTKRRAKRSAYDTYLGWYGQYTKGWKKRLFKPVMYEKERFEGDQDSFEYWYKHYKAAGMKNPARFVAMSQEYVGRGYEKAMVKEYGIANMPDLSDKKIRHDIVADMIDELRAKGMSQPNARRQVVEYIDS